MRCTATVLLAFKGKEFSSSAMISFVTSLLPTSYLTGWWALNMNLLCRLLQGETRSRFDFTCVCETMKWHVTYRAYWRVWNLCARLPSQSAPSLSVCLSSSLLIHPILLPWEIFFFLRWHHGYTYSITWAMTDTSNHALSEVMGNMSWFLSIFTLH